MQINPNATNTPQEHMLIKVKEDLKAADLKTLDEHLDALRVSMLEGSRNMKPLVMPEVKSAPEAAQALMDLIGLLNDRAYWKSMEFELTQRVMNLVNGLAPTDLVGALVKLSSMQKEVSETISSRRQEDQNETISSQV